MEGFSVGVTMQRATCPGCGRQVDAVLLEDGRVRMTVHYTEGAFADPCPRSSEVLAPGGGV